MRHPVTACTACCRHAQPGTVHVDYRLKLGRWPARLRVYVGDTPPRIGQCAPADGR
jgi:hypothetical protein